MKVAVIGSGVSGLAAAWTLSRSGAQVVVYEKDGHVGGHAHTFQPKGTNGRGEPLPPVDLGFMVFNTVTYPNLVDFFEEIGAEVEPSDMSFAVSVDRCEWGSNGLAGLFAQRRNLLRPSFWRMLREMHVFHMDVLRYLEKMEKGDAAGSKFETLGEFLSAHGYSSMFTQCYLVPVCASIWSCGSEGVLSFSAFSVLSFLRNHHMLQILGRPQWLTVRNRSESYVKKVVEAVEKAGGGFRVKTEVSKVASTADGKVSVTAADGSEEIFDSAVIAAHAPDALSLLGAAATQEEQRILVAFEYSTSDIVLHSDAAFMPKRRAAWSAWNFLGNNAGRVAVTYWLNTLQNLGDAGLPLLVTLNPPLPPNAAVVHHRWTTSHPVPSPAAAAASRQLAGIQGARGIWFAGAYTGYGFHEDGFVAGIKAAQGILGQTISLRPYWPQMKLTWLETIARLAVVKFLQPFVQIGSVQMLELGGSVLRFGQSLPRTSKEGSVDGSNLSCQLAVRSPAFYWKVATRADLGLADAFIDGDFMCRGGPYGLLKFLEICIANRDRSRYPGQLPPKARGWWSPHLLTALIGSFIMYAKHLLRFNNLTNARRNISNHYDLSNEMFGKFLDPTMTYSCAVFERPHEDLKEAQLRKLHMLIDKARIEPHHHVLEIGFGWGSLAIEAVKKYGCKWTGITLSAQQMKLATERVKAAGLEDKMTFLLCDYRQLPGRGRFDRILSCEMLEAVGHEFFPDFFQNCDRLLAMDGLLVLQVITTPEVRYEEYRKSSDFIKEYIFPGCCVPSTTALMSAMASASSFSVEHLENIGPHYATTLLRWMETFEDRKSEIHAMGFGDKFCRMWMYYFVYCAVGFKTRTLGDVQLVLSRPNNVRTLGPPPEEDKSDI